MAVEMHVFGVVMDEESNVPILVLREIEGDRTLPIQIGFSEAGAIASELEGIDVPRPLTHDLFVSVLSSLDSVVLGAAVTDLRDSTFFAEVTIGRGGDVFKFDCRPSDAVALALRAKAPITVADVVFSRMEPADAAERSRVGWMNFVHSLEALSAVENSKTTDLEDGGE